MIRVRDRAVVGVIVAVAGGCGGAGQPASLEAPVTPATAPAAASEQPEVVAILGRWESDLPESIEQYEDGLPPSGRYGLLVEEDVLVLTLPAPHRFPTLEVVEMSDTGSVTGTIRLTDEQALEEDGCFEGHLGDVGTYRWSVEGDELRFETVDDPCVDRPLIFSSSTWKRVDP